jgi:integrase
LRNINADAWQRACDKAGITDFRWHDLRHTWASWHVQNGTSLQELMELGGWKSYKMVLRYAHLAGDHLRNAAGNITNSLRCAAQPEMPVQEVNH